MIIKRFTERLNENNCNYRLETLYNMRDRISETISIFLSAERNTDRYEKEYNNYCDTIDELLHFRRNHNCILKGDPEYKED